MKGLIFTLLCIFTLSSCRTDISGTGCQVGKYKRTFYCWTEQDTHIGNVIITFSVVLSSEIDNAAVFALVNGTSSHEDYGSASSSFSHGQNIDRLRLQMRTPHLTATVGIKDGKWSGNHFSGSPWFVLNGDSHYFGNVDF
ncbi:hypothetical protein PCE1_000487 [Barthelona sp. PCE]